MTSVGGYSNPAVTHPLSSGGHVKERTSAHGETELPSLTKENMPKEVAGKTGADASSPAAIVETRVVTDVSRQLKRKNRRPALSPSSVGTANATEAPKGTDAAAKQVRPKQRRLAPSSPSSVGTAGATEAPKGTGAAATGAAAKQVRRKNPRPAPQPVNPVDQPVTVNPVEYRGAVGGALNVVTAQARTKNLVYTASKEVAPVAVYKEGDHKPKEVAMHFTASGPKFNKNDGGFPPGMGTIGVCNAKENTNSVLCTNGISDCIAVAVLAEPDGKGVFQKRVLVHLEGGKYSGNSPGEGAPDLKAQFKYHLDLDDDAMANCQVIVCFGSNYNDIEGMEGIVKDMTSHLGADPKNVTHMKSEMSSFAVKPDGKYGEANFSRK